MDRSSRFFVHVSVLLHFLIFVCWFAFLLKLADVWHLQVENWEPSSPKAKDVLGTDGYIAPEAYLGNSLHSVQSSLRLACDEGVLPTRLVPPRQLFSRF